MDLHSEGLNGMIDRNKLVGFKAYVYDSCSVPLERLHPQMEPLLEPGMVHINFFPKVKIFWCFYVFLSL